MLEAFAEQELQFLERDEGYWLTGCSSQQFGHLWNRLFLSKWSRGFCDGKEKEKWIMHLNWTNWERIKNEFWTKEKRAAPKRLLYGRFRKGKRKMMLDSLFRYGYNSTYLIAAWTRQLLPFILLSVVPKFDGFSSSSLTQNSKLRATVLPYFSLIYPVYRLPFKSCT
jgi:hypothetical protein